MTSHRFLRTSVWLVLLQLMTSHRVGATMSEMMAFQMTCQDDSTSVQSLYHDCRLYMLCHSGMVITLSCPQGYVFNDFSLRCQLPSPRERQRCSNILLAGMPFTCLWQPRARLPSYLSCAQYLDCGPHTPSSGAPASYVSECPYPQLFSAVNGRCEPHQLVDCTGRNVPRAPCDYLQYQQLCEGPDCFPCEQRHPSCVGKRDGLHAVSNSTHVFYVCQLQRTVHIGTCPSGTVFVPSQQTCRPPPKHAAASLPSSTSSSSSSSSSSPSAPIILSEQRTPTDVEFFLRQLLNLGRSASAVKAISDDVKSGFSHQKAITRTRSTLTSGDLGATAPREIQNGKVDNGGGGHRVT